MAEARGLRRQTTDAATEWAFTAGWRLVRLLPEPAARAAFDQVADASWLRRGEGVVQLERNLRRVYPELDPHQLRLVSRDAMRSYMRYWCEAFRLPAMSQQRIRDGFVLWGEHVLDAAMASGSGAIMVVNHGGNWDMAGAWAAQRYGAVTTVAERLKPEAIFQKFLAYRQALGMEILPLGEASTFRSLADRLRAGGLVALVGDRDISRNGVTVDLLGRPASLPAGPALLSQLTGAPLHPVTLWFEGPTAMGEVGPRITVPDGTREERTRAMTQGVADWFSAGLHEHGVDWHMLQPVWTSDLHGGAR